MVTYDIQEYRGAQSAKVDVYLIPSDDRLDGEMHICTLLHVGGGVPEPAYHHRWLNLGWLWSNFVGSSLLEHLKSKEHRLRELDQAYKGSEWNGHNHVGQWDTDVTENPFYGELVTDEDVQFFWEASEWLSECTLGDLIGNHKSIDDIVSAVVDEATGTAVLNRDDVESAVQSQIQDWIDEHELDEDLDEDDAVLLSRLQGLLSLNR